MEPNYVMSKNRFEGLARSFGIGALVCAFFFSTLSIVSIGFGFLAILFAILSKGYERKMGQTAKSGLYIGIAAIVLSVSITGFTLLRFMTDSEYRSTIMSTMESVYGDTYKEVYGIDVEEMFNQFLPENK